MSSKSLRCAVLGVGRMGRHHARVMSRQEDVEFLGVLDRDQARVTQAVEQHGGRAFSSLEDLLAAAPDCAVVATPTVTHPELVVALLERGVSCLVEKPLAADIAQSRRIADAARRSGAALQVGHVVRYDPVMRAIRGIEGLRPLFIQVERVSPMTFRSVDVGVVLDMMIHDLDLLMMLVGHEPEEIAANAVCVVGEAEDVCNARLTFPPGPGGVRCVANVTASRLAMKTERKMRIISEEHYVSADFGARTGTVVRKTANRAQLEEVRARLRGGEDLSSLNYLELVKVDPLQVGSDDPLTLQARDFLDAVRTGRRPEVDAEAGLAAVRTAERIVEVARRAGARMV
ncbi:MAG: Gfo/Idh/MocA family oxidoreductase [Phycisphaerae bacterium]|nr:Gfo/Idh/MocA family oxidoreductase [Phycisphaerae bacterium]